LHVACLLGVHIVHVMLIEKQILLKNKNMIYNFKLFTEKNITIQNKELNFDYSNNNKDTINTSLGKTSKGVKYSPRITTLFNSRVKIYSPYSKKSSSRSTDILKSIKKKSEIKMDELDYIKFIKRTAIFFMRIIRKESIDTILVMESSSTLVQDLVDEIKDKLSDKSIKVFNDSIKKDITNLRVIRPLKMSDSEFDGANNVILNAKENDNFEIKKIHPKHRKYVTGWIKVDDSIKKEISNKNVIIFDDYITSGSTLDAICVELKLLEPNNLFGMTIIKG
jgi:hypothetical protein